MRSRNSKGASAYANSNMTQTAGRQVDVLSAATFAEDEYAPHFSGQVMKLNHAGTAVIGQKINGQKVGRYGMTGLDNVESVTTREDGTVMVRFLNGERVIVDLKNAHITSSVPGVPNAEMVAALYEALAAHGKDDPRFAGLVAALEAYHGDREDLALLAIAASEGEKVLAGMDTFRIQVDSQEAPSDMQERSQALHDALTNRAAPMWMDRLQRSLPKGMSIFGAVRYPNRDAIALEQARFDSNDWEVEDMKEAVRALSEMHNQPEWATKAADATTKKQMEAIAKTVDADVTFGSPGPISIAARMKTARDLGLPIYEPDMNYVAGNDITEASISITNDLNAGTRAFALYGPPGTGKNKFIEELAASSFMPVFEVDFGAGDSMRDLLGDTGLKDGNTQLQVGTLARALSAKGGCYAVYNEFISAPKAEQTTLHNLLGSGIDQTKGRAIMFKSSETSERVRMEIDPDSVQFLTYNPGRGDERPNEAVMRRVSALAFEYPSEDDEVAKTCHMIIPAVGRLAANSTNPGAESWKYDPDLTRVNADGIEEDVAIAEQMPEMATEVRRAVRFARHLRSMYYDDAVEHFMDGTTLSRFVTQIITETHFIGPDFEPINGVELAAKKLDFMIDQSLPPDERRATMDDALTTFYPDAMGSKGSNGIGL